MNEPRYEDICSAYYSIQTYVYAYQDSYRSFRAYIEKADTIYPRFGNWGYIDSVNISGLFITYLEIFVGLRWCAKNIFSEDPKQVGLINEEKYKEAYKAAESNLHIIDRVFWLLRNEIHHSQLTPLRPGTILLNKKGEIIEAKSGLVLPKPKKIPEQSKLLIEDYFQNWHKDLEISQSTIRSSGYIPFLIALEKHYATLLPFHNNILLILEAYSQDKYGKSIQIKLIDWALTAIDSSTDS
jgi:hypothetical protein